MKPRHKALLSFVAIACIGLAGSSAAALARPAPPSPQLHTCALGEWSGQVTRGVNDSFAGGNAEPTALSALQSGLPTLNLNLQVNVYDQTASNYQFVDTLGFSPPAGFTVTKVALTDDLPTTTEIFQAGIDEAARELGKESRLRPLTPQQRRARAEFVFGNMLFVTQHELGHALVSELDLMVLGREEDVADAYATLGALKCGADFSRRVLVEAAKGWFMTAQRDKKAGQVPHYYERHGLDEQRAYQIVCLMVGSDPVRFKDLADETGLPEERRRSCGWDYDTASRSWDRALAPHQRAADQPKAPIQVVYGEGKGKLAAHARIFRATRFMETIVEQVADRFAWPAPMVVEMRSCPEPNARWTISTRRLHVCYELAQEFVELYRDFGGDRTLARARLRPEQRFAARPQNIVRSIGAWRESKLGRRSAR